MSLTTPVSIRTLQRKLYCKANAEPAYRFSLLYDKIHRDDILAHADALARANAGTPRVDGMTFAAVEAMGLEEWLAEIRKDLVAKTYRPAPVRHRSHRLLYGGHDPGACARYFGALASWSVGYPDEALALGGEALAFAERLAHPFSLQDALLWNAMLHVDWGEAETAPQRLAAVEALVAEQRLGFIVEPSLIRGAALSALGALEEAVVCLREGLASRLGALLLRLYGIVHLAEALAGQAEYEAALVAAMERLKVQEETGHRQWEAELRRVEGIALFGLNRLEEVQNALEEALRVAGSQQAKSYEPRAATSLARLWGEQSRRTEALDLLAPVYGWFTEGFDTADLKEAKALLDQLA